MLALRLTPRKQPVLGDTSGDNYANYTACAPNAEDRNAAGAAFGCGCGAMGPAGVFRLKGAGGDATKTAAAVALWTEAVEKFHRPEEGINIAIGPVTCYSASVELITAGAALRKKYGLAGHTHLLETQGQKLQSRQYFGKKGAVGMLKETGFLARGAGRMRAHLPTPRVLTHFFPSFQTLKITSHRICRARPWPTPCGWTTRRLRWWPLLAPRWSTTPRRTCGWGRASPPSAATSPPAPTSPLDATARAAATRRTWCGGAAARGRAIMFRASPHFFCSFFFPFNSPQLEVLKLTALMHTLGTRCVGIGFVGPRTVTVGFSQLVNDS